LISGKTILISALDWGLGHATRCVPLIHELKKNNTVIIGVTPLTRTVFEEEFPGLQKVELPAYNVRYSKILPLWLKLLLSWPAIKAVIKQEEEIAGELVQKLKIDVLISDNRFGFRSKKAHSVFITHQLFLKTPFAAGIAQRINRKYINLFDEVWVPDYEQEANSLSGELSHGTHFHKNVKYIGPQSRLVKNEHLGIKYDVLFLLSGPEPQHSILASKLLQVTAEHDHLKFVLASSHFSAGNKKNLEVYTAPTAAKLGELVAQSRKIVCRSGYSTLMDLHLLGKKDLVLIPTPGQTEQEYLARLWEQKFRAKHVSQRSTDPTIFE
jgi:spore coat polysaccharide biosynthesis predicted glycosyltransferase SpsG